MGGVLIDSSERRVIVWWWDVLGTAKDVDSIYRWPCIAVQLSLSYFAYMCLSLHV